MSSSGMTAAEKRAARRARVLASSEDRMKLVSGQISSLKEPTEDQQMDDAANELLSSGDNASADLTNKSTDASKTEQQEESSTLQIPRRVDPAARRRAAAARRKQQEEQAQSILEASADEPSTSTNKPRTEKSVQKPVTAPKTVGGHALALRMQSMEQKLVLCLLIGAAIFMAFQVNVSYVVEALQMDKTIFEPYQDLLNQGMPVDTIRNQLQRDHLEPSAVSQVEEWLEQQAKKVSSADGSLGAGFLQDLIDFPTSLVSSPPLLLIALAIRFGVSIIFGIVRTSMQLPSIDTGDKGSMGMIANFLLANRPALKQGIQQAMRIMNDSMRFLFVFILALSARCLYLAA